jgi:iron-sulfur cluster repair protein YtfE (RIC family)
MIEIIFGGLLGAIIGAIIVAAYEEYKFKRMNELSTAREKLEKLYSPLYFFLENSKLISGKDEDRFLHTKEEGKLIDEIILKYFYLADEDLRKNIFLLHSVSRYKSGNKDIFKEIFSNIREGHNKYCKILGLS